MNPFKYGNALNNPSISTAGRGAIPMAAIRVVGAALLIIMGATTSHLRAQTSPTRGNAQVVAQIMQSVVMVEATARASAPSAQTLGPLRVGSGIVIDRDTVVTVGYLLIEAETADIIDSQGRRIPATIVGHDPISGFGVLKSLLPLQRTPVALGDSDRLIAPQRLLTRTHRTPSSTRARVTSNA
jgi:S1-C subfamily serine protease